MPIGCTLAFKAHSVPAGYITLRLNGGLLGGKGFGGLIFPAGLRQEAKEVPITRLMNPFGYTRYNLRMYIVLQGTQTVAEGG